MFVASYDEIDSILGVLPEGTLEPIGGELFLFPDMLEYIFSKYNYKFNFNLTTNCMVRNKEVENLIFKYVKNVRVSLDSPTTMEKQRIGSNLNSALEYALYLNEHIPVTVSSVITPENINHIKETFDFYCIKNKFNSILFEVDESSINQDMEIYTYEMKRLIDSYVWNEKKIENFSNPPFIKKTEYFNDIRVDFLTEGDMDTPKRIINRQLREYYKK